ncbi:MAG: DNA mismatch repair protein MutS, partial [Gemmatimonadetes bacterium]|nr:DNA mismatch repair protein MutS [Gemmatimonadota bacterium]
PALRETLAKGSAARLTELRESLTPMNALADRIEETIVPEPPASIRDGGFIRKGFHAELDELRALGSDVQEWLAKFQEEEREKTGIQTIKVKFNKVFGYYIEVSKAKSGDVPPEYVRKQTLVNAERYITPALKEQEEKILSAEEKIRALEEELFYELREETASHVAELRALARASAELDVLFAFADLASARNYCRPKMTGDRRIKITGGRHPVVETLLDTGDFIPNDTTLDPGDGQIHLITGPNMAGKSTYLRQVALIQILAQTGSWVPAKSARLGVVDRVFTRVGASDDLARGQSTFLVEMTETANILHNATGESLVLLDEIGRGTSTYDGVSIAWAVVEYLHDHASVAAKTLFATHYHELSELEGRLERVRNFSVRVEERGEEIVFLRRIGPGSIDRSYGIQVARLAGLPAPVIRRAMEVLRKLEQDHPQQPVGAPIARDRSPQIDLFPGEGDTILEELRALDPNQVTPFDALSKLKDYRDRLREDEGGPGTDGTGGEDAAPPNENAKEPRS